MEPNEAQTAPKWGTWGLEHGAGGAQWSSNRFKYAPSEAQWGSDGAQWGPTGVQMELKWEANPYEVPSKINCAIALIAQRLHVHFDTLFGQKKAPKSAWIPEKRVLNIVATKQLDVLRSITFYPRKTAFSIVKQHRRWVHCLPCQLKQTPSRARYKNERLELRLRRIFCSDLGSLPTPSR